MTTWVDSAMHDRAQKLDYSCFTYPAPFSALAALDISSRNAAHHRVTYHIVVAPPSHEQTTVR